MVTALAPFPYLITPMANVAPFTYADGATYLSALEGMKTWLNETLVPYVADAYADALAQAQNGVGNAEQTVIDAKADWDTRYDALMADLTAQIAVLNDAAVGSLVNNAASTTGTALRTLINGTIDNRLTADVVIGFIAGTYYNKTQADALFATKTDTTAQLATAAANVAAGYAPIAGADYAAPGDTAANANHPTKVGVVLDRGTAGQWDAGLVESLHVINDPESGRLAGVYVGYNDTTDNLSTSVGQIGLAYSDDGLTWEKAGVLLPPSGTAGAGDVAGTSGPVLVLDNGIYHLFYIGLSANGYEGGTKTLMLATSPSLKNPVWTRRGAVLSAGGSGWRSLNVWHPSIVKHRGTWYCFINASGVIGGVDRERIGYATATTLTGPWTFDDVNSPLLFNPAGICGDPSVSKIPGGWRMDYFTSDSGTAADWYTTTTDTAFPLGWRAHNASDTARRTVQPGPLGTMDDTYAHKPYLFRYAGRTIHYYTAVSSTGVRRCAAAVDGPYAGNRGPSRVSATQPVYGTFSHVKSALGQADAIVGSTDFSLAMPSVACVSAKAGDLLEFTVNYGANNEAVELRADVCLLSGPSGGTALTYVSGQPTGISGWGMGSGVKDYRSATFKYRVTDADIVKGVVTAAPVFKTESGTRRVFCMDVVPLEFSAHNLG